MSLLLMVAAANRSTLSAPATPSAEYRFAPGDVIEVTITPQKGFDRTLTVQPDGKVSYPMAGQFQAAGLTVEQLSRELSDRLNRELNDPQVTVILKERNRDSDPRATLLGAVRNPNVYVIKDGTTVAELLASGGGASAQADLKRVTITRPDHSVVTVNLEQTNETGRIERDVILQAGDIVVVPAGVIPTVLVLGEVKKPGPYEITRGSRLLDALSLAGGLTEKADLHRVSLMRLGAASTRTFNLRPFLVEGTAIDPELNVLLQPGDAIVVTESDQRVYVLGRVAKPDTYPIKPTDRALDLLAMAGGPNSDGDVSKTVLVRRDANGQPVAKNLDMKKVMEGKLAENEPLRPGDVLYVPDKKKGRSASDYYSTVWSLIGLSRLFGF